MTTTRCPSLQLAPSIPSRAAITLAMILLGSLFGAPRASADPLLLGAWDFENNYLDSSGNGHDLTPSSSPAPTFVAGVTSGTYGISFASSSYARATGFTGPENDFTVDFDFQSTMTSGIGQMLTTLNHAGSAGGGGWNIVLNNGKVEFNTRDPNQTTGEYIITQNSYADDQWHHVVATMSSSYYLTLNIDGSEVVAGQGQGHLGNRLDLTFGHAAGTATIYPYTGALDNVRFYSNTGVVPEPSSLLMTALGLIGGVGVVARRRGV